MHGIDTFKIIVYYSVVPRLGTYKGVVHLRGMVLTLVVEGKKNIYSSKTHKNEMQ